MKSIGRSTGFVEANGFGFCSGLVGIDEGGLILPGLEAQVQSALTQLDTLLEEYGLDSRSVVKTTIYMAYEEDYEMIDNIYKEFFSESLPARTSIVTKLPKKSDEGPNEILFEVDAVVAMAQYEDQGY